MYKMEININRASGYDYFTVNGYKVQKLVTDLTGANVQVIADANFDNLQWSKNIKDDAKVLAVFEKDDVLTVMPHEVNQGNYRGVLATGVLKGVSDEQMQQIWNVLNEQNAMEQEVKLLEAELAGMDKTERGFHNRERKVKVLKNKLRAKVVI